jgi:hypothetical protein
MKNSNQRLGQSERTVQLKNGLHAIQKFWSQQAKKKGIKTDKQLKHYLKQK